MYEVDQNGNIVWGPYNADSQKAFRYECEHPAIPSLEPYMNSTATTSCFSTLVDDLQIESIAIYPNPTNGYLNITLPKDISSTSLKVHNSIGQEILKLDNLKVYNTQKIDLSNYPQGFYHFSIFEDDKKLNSYKLNLIK